MGLPMESGTNPLSSQIAHVNTRRKQELEAPSTNQAPVRVATCDGAETASAPEYTLFRGSESRQRKLPDDLAVLPRGSPLLKRGTSLHVRRNLVEHLPRCWKPLEQFRNLAVFTS